MALHQHTHTFILITIVMLMQAAIPAMGQDEGFTAPLSPTGRILVSQFIPEHTDVTWTYSADAHFEFLRGKGHRAWFGVKYRQRAGWADEATITVFDPNYIDSWQVLSWRWKPESGPTLFYHMQRVCFHLIDRQTTGSTIWTHAGFGAGTLSPIERYSLPIRFVESNRKTALEGYLFSGPYIHGGFSGILGNRPIWQWQTGGYAAGYYRIGKRLTLELIAKADLLTLTPAKEERWRWRGHLQVGVVVTGTENGALTLGLESVLHDDYPERALPTGQRVVLEYEF